MAIPLPSPTNAQSINTYGVGRNYLLPVAIWWGTDNVINGTIVKDLRSIPMIEEIKIEGGSGLTYTQLLLNDGWEVEVTCVDDRTVTWPSPGSTISVLNPSPNGATGTIMLYEVVNNNYSAARKSEGTRTIMAKQYSMFTPIQM